MISLLNLSSRLSRYLFSILLLLCALVAVACSAPPQADVMVPAPTATLMPVASPTVLPEATDAPATEPPAPTVTVPATATTADEPTAAPEIIVSDGDGDEPTTTFDGETTLQLVADQLAFGPRYPGSEGHLLLRDWIQAELEAKNLDVALEQFSYKGFGAMNIVGKANVGAGPIIILGAHYDTRARADQSGVDDPVLGAVDGGSGVAVLLELADVLEYHTIPNEIWFTFFDVEDNGSGGIEGWGWIAGSTYMAEKLPEPIDQYEAMVLVDMVGQVQQELYYEANSNPAVREELWMIAAEQGYSDFIPTNKYSMIDDHIPFLRRGIPAVDIIDFDYDGWHTINDTLDQMSADSLERVGRVIEIWLETK